MVKEEAVKTDKAVTRTGTDRALLDQLRQLQAQLLDENRQLRELLAARLGDANRAPRDERLEQWEAQRRAAAQRIEAQLQGGPLQFQVSHPGDPTRLVGAADRSEAIAKYRSYFGIVQTSQEFVVHEIPAAAEPAAA